MLFDLKKDFYDWAIKEIEKSKKEEKKILAFCVDEPSHLQPLIDKNFSLNFKTLKEIELKKDIFYDFILCPSFFLYSSKDQAKKASEILSEILKESGEIFVFFGPPWLSSAIAEDGAKILKDKNDKIILRYKNNIFSFSFFSNREIEKIFPSLKLKHLTILQNGFRRANFQKVKKEGI